MMTKLILGLILLFSLAVVGAASLAKAQASANSAAIICSIAELREDDNFDVCVEVELQVSQRLRTIHDAFMPIAWLGGTIAAIASFGLVISIRKRSNVVVSDA